MSLNNQNPFNPNHKPVAHMLYESLIEKSTPEVLNINELRNHFGFLCKNVVKFEFDDGIDWLKEQDLICADQAQKLKVKRQQFSSVLGFTSGQFEKTWMTANIFDFKEYLDSLNLE